MLYLYQPGSPEITAQVKDDLRSLMKPGAMRDLAVVAMVKGLRKKLRFDQANDVFEDYLDSDPYAWERIRHLF